MAAVARFVPLGHGRVIAVLYGGTVIALISVGVAYSVTDFSIVGAAVLISGPMLLVAVVLVRTAIATGKAKAEARARGD